MNYIDPSTGATYALDTARWCADNGNYLNSACAGLRRSEIDVSRYSVWRYAKALLVNAADAVTMARAGRRCCAATGMACRDLQTRVHDADGSFKDRGMTVM